jgi:hypothetical protein
MVERQHYYGHLVFDRDAIVRAALRAYVELRLARLDPLARHRFIASSANEWAGDLQRGAFSNDNREGDYEVVAWTEAGVVGLAYDLGCGPIEQLDLEIDDVTGGPDDVRGAVPELPDELEPAFLMAVSMLGVGPEHGERDAGVGFWLHGDRVGGSFFLFTDPTLAWGAKRLAAWGKLRDGRLSVWWDRGHVLSASEAAQTIARPIHAIIDAVTARRLAGPTALTPDELATLCPTPPDPEQLVAVQRRLQKVGINWPGSPELPE